jgi:hypothetical protein
MITRILAVAAVPAVVLSISASVAAAAVPGSYSGTSVNKEIYRYGDVDPRTEKGKVTFAVKSNVVKNFKLKSQQIMCGASPAEVAVAIPKMKLNASGRGKGTYTNSDVGAFEVKITVRDNGKASGTITPTGLCRGTATFTAKHQ